MNKFIIAVAGLAISSGVAIAAPQVASDVDNVQSSPVKKQSSPGTVGGMTRVSSDVATGSDDVKRQQEGGSVNGTLGAKREGNAALTRHSPGTVGASPGYTYGR